MKKIYVLDTSVILHDPYSFKSFKENLVCIPITCLDEIDKIKKYPDEAGKNARVFIRTLDKLCDNQDLNKGIKLENDISLFIEHDISGHEQFGTSLYGDNRILGCVKNLQEKNKKNKVILISKDISLRIRSRYFGFNAEDYNTDKVQYSELYSGIKEIDLSLTDEDINCFFTKGYLYFGDSFAEENEVYANQFIKINYPGMSDSITVRYDYDKKIFKAVNKPKDIFGISAKNYEQGLAINLLLDDSIPLVSLTGHAGSGKTLLGLAAGLHQVLEKRKYDKIILMKPIETVGKDLGILPGTKEEKLAPFIASYKDNLEFIMSNSSNKNKIKKNKNNDELSNIDPYISLLFDKGVIEVEAISYLRGRSLPNCFIIIDESQGTSLHIARTICTRMGFGSKLALLGDITQQDSEKLDALNNGLVHVIEKFKPYSLAGHLTLTKGERSPLATLASEIL